jgi:hypothetical protein
MDKNILLSFRQMQSDGSWAEDADTVSLAKGASLTSSVIDISQTSGIIGFQVYHASDGAATLLVEVEESVDGVTYVLNSTQVVAALAKSTTALYTHDAHANRFIKIKITENDIAATVVTLSLAIR